MRFLVPNRWKSCRKPLRELIYRKLEYSWGINTFNRTVVEDLHRSWRPRTSNTEGNIDKVKIIVLESRLTNLKELVSELNNVYGTTWHIVVDIFGMWCVTARLVPKGLTFVQKRHWKTVAEDLIFEAKNDPTFRKRIITGVRMQQSVRVTLRKRAKSKKKKKYS